MKNLDLIKELYRAFREKDYTALKRICTADIEWIQNPGFPKGSTWHGANQVIEGVFEAFDDNWESWKFEIEEYLEAGNSVVVIGTYSGIYQKTGKSFRSAAAHLYDIEEGKVSKFRQFTDTKLIWDAMG